MLGVAAGAMEGIAVFGHGGRDHAVLVQLLHGRHDEEPLGELFCGGGGVTSIEGEGGQTVGSIPYGHLDLRHQELREGPGAGALGHS